MRTFFYNLNSIIDLNKWIFSEYLGEGRYYLSLVLLFILNFFFPASLYANTDIDPPLTAHSNYHNIITHRGLSWTPDNVLGENILVINSFHEGDKKTDDLMKGIYETFDSSNKNINIFIEYMDAKRYSSDYHKKNLAQVYKYKYTNKRFAAIIVSGYDALQFVRTYRSEIFHSTPVIFSGINNYTLSSLTESLNTTGVVESGDAIATIALALKLHPDIHQVLILSPGKRNSPIPQEITRKFHSKVKLLYWHELYYSDIEKKIEALDKKTIILPIAEPKTKAGSSISYADFVKRIVHITNSPVYCLWDTALGTGAVGGKLISSYLQGKTAAEMALQILSGKDVNEIPVKTDNLNKYMFDYNRLRFFSINQSDLPDNSVIINNPFSLYTKYKKEINAALILVLLQAIIIFHLIIAYKRRRKAENELKAINDELELRVTQRTNEISHANELLLREIDERILIQKALSFSEEKFSKAFLSCPDGIAITRLSDDCLIEVNGVFEQYSGYSREEAIGKTSLELGLWCNPDDRKKLITNVIQEGTCRDFETTLKSKSGNIYDASISIDTVNIAGDMCLLTIARDITEHKRINIELRRYEKIVSSTKDSISFVDTKYIYQAINKSFINAFGLKNKKVVGCHIADIHGEERFNTVIKPNIDRCLGGITVNIQDRIKLSKYGYRHFDILYSPYYEDDKVMGVVVTARDMTHTYELSNQLAYQASHDALTGLINRREFENRLQRILEHVKTHKDQYVLCYMDLDQFKVINDNCGHAAGDELLRQLGKLMQQSVREQDTLARLGGDEFAAIIENCTIKKAQEIVNNLQNTIDNFRFEWENKTYRIGTSIGLVPVTSRSGNTNELLKQADAACYVAKNEGRNRVHLYKQNDAKLEKHHFEMQGVMHVQSALDENRLCLYKQAIVPINSNIKDNGEHYEILLRLEKDGEILLPNIFLPAAEQYGLSNKIDAWVINKLFTWLTEDMERQKNLSLCSINLSAYSLNTEGLLDFILDRLDELPVSPEKICFEITETATIANYEKAINFIKKLRNRGCHFALDDFGSGFSSFAYLKNLEVDYLKIDGMFIRDMLIDPIAFSMVKSINEIGHVVGIKTIAEFVESDKLLQKLRDINVDFVQGHAIGVPQPINSPLPEQPVKSKEKIITHTSNYLKH